MNDSINDFYIDIKKYIKENNITDDNYYEKLDEEMLENIDKYYNIYYK